MYNRTRNTGFFLDNMQALFTDLETVFDLGVDKSKVSAYTEVIRAEKNEEGYNIQFSLPGYDKEDIRISLEKNDLVVSARFEKDENWKKTFHKRIALPDDADFSKSEATLEKGILEIQLPFKADQKSVEIKIS
jgi:HSP20 family protein